MTKNNGIEIREVTSKTNLRRFVDFPNILYKDVEAFVPALFADDLNDWNPKKNPAFSYCETKCFLAYKDGKIVGRIGAILSHRANKTWNTKRMRFSQVDFIDDREVSAALFGAVESWAQEKGCDQVHGPLGFCDLNREGMLIEGFDRRSMFITYYNHPYYKEHLEALGYGKDTDWVENLITLPTAESETAQKLSRLSEWVLKRKKLHKLDIKSSKDITTKQINQVFGLLNDAYAPLYGVVELEQNQIDKYAKEFVPMINPNLFCMVMDEQEELVAFGMCLPSLADAVKKSSGRLFPLGWLRVLHALKHNHTLDMMLIAVKPELQGSGINAIVMDHIVQGAIKMGIRYAESGPTLETNDKVQSQWKFFEHEQHKRRRCFIKNLTK